MPYSEFVRLFKCASMLSAREKLATINVANFAYLEKPDREKVAGDLKRAATQFVEQRVKDYREVIGNLAKRLMNGGR
jgi:hypothetical protein